MLHERAYRILIKIFPDLSKFGVNDLVLCKTDNNNSDFTVRVLKYSYSTTLVFSSKIGEWFVNISNQSCQVTYSDQHHKLDPWSDKFFSLVFRKIYQQRFFH